jgi:hypothetical protein
MEALVFDAFVEILRWVSGDARALTYFGYSLNHNIRRVSMRLLGRFGYRSLIFARRNERSREKIREWSRKTLSFPWMKSVTPYYEIPMIYPEEERMIFFSFKGEDQRCCSYDLAYDAYDTLAFEYTKCICGVITYSFHFDLDVDRYELLSDLGVIQTGNDVKCGQHVPLWPEYHGCPLLLFAEHNLILRCYVSGSPMGGMCCTMHGRWMPLTTLRELCKQDVTVKLHDRVLTIPIGTFKTWIAKWIMTVG